GSGAAHTTAITKNEERSERHHRYTESGLAGRRIPARRHRRRNEDELPRLRDERDRGAGPARRSRRIETGPPRDRVGEPGGRLRRPRALSHVLQERGRRDG